MALKVLMLRKKAEKKKEKLKELRKKISEFETREAELEKSIDEVTTEEEQAVIDEEIEEFDDEKKSFDQEIAQLEAEIAATEKEIADEEKKNDAISKTDDQKKGIETKQNERGDQRSMNTRKKSFGMNYEQRSAFTQHEKVKDFVSDIRNIAGEKRSISGAELNIPTVVLGVIRDNLHRYSKLIDKINLKRVKGKARQNIIGSTPEGIWMEMADKLEELEFGFSGIDVDGYKVGGFIPISNYLLEDSDEDLVFDIMDMISQALGMALDKAILYGKSKRMPLGIVTRLAQTEEPSNWPTKGPKWNDLHVNNLVKFSSVSMKGDALLAKIITLSSIPKANYASGGKFWCMNDQTKTSIQAKLVTANSAGVFVASVSNEMPIVGGEIIVLPFIPDGDVIFGYPSLYLLSERAGGTLAQSKECQFIEDNTIFKGTARYDGTPVFGEAFAAFNINDKDVTTSIAFAGIQEGNTPSPANNHEE